MPIGKTILPFLAVAAAIQAQPYAVASIAGGGPTAGMAATAAFVPGPLGVVWDPLGRFYVSMVFNGRVMRVNQNGVVDMVAGSGRPGDGGLASSPTVRLQPGGLALDRNGNLYLAELTRVRKLEALTGIISTVAGTGIYGFSGDGGLATNASLNSVESIATDSTGNLYIADSGNRRIRKVAAGTGIITTVAGNGTSGFGGDGGQATNATLGERHGIAVDAAGNLFLADFCCSTRIGKISVRKISATTGVITSIVAGGSASVGNFDSTGDRVGSIALDSSGNIFVATNGKVWKVSPSTGAITAWAIASGNPESDLVIASDASGNLLAASFAENVVLRVDGVNASTSTVAGSYTTDPIGNGVLATTAVLRNPVGLALDAAGSIYVGDSAFYSGRVRRIGAGSSIIATIAGNGFGGDGGFAINAQLGGFVFIGNNDTPFLPVAVDPSGNVYIIETGSPGSIADANFRIRMISAQTGIITTIAGGGTLTGGSADGMPAVLANLGAAQDLFIDSANMYLTDGGGQLRKVSLASGVITTVASNLSAGSFDRDASGNVYFTSGDSIGKFTAATGAVATIVGALRNCTAICDPTVFGTYPGAQLGDGATAKNARLNAPQGVKVDRAGNLYIADTGDHRIRFVSAATGVISTIAGVNAAGCSGNSGLATGAVFTSPSKLALDRNGGVYVADPDCGQIFKLIPYSGYVDQATCQTISGWAADLSRPGQSITVSIYDGSTLLTTIAANQPRPDVATALGDNGLHGFSYAVPASLRDGQAHSIHAVFEASGLDIAGSPKTLTCTIGANYTGYIDSSSCAGISGWAADRNRLNQAILASLWDGATQIASATAAASRPDVGAAIGDGGLHGFTLQLPAAYMNGISRTLQVRYETSATVVPGVPIKLTCGSGATNYAGYVDGASCSGINGWAADRNRANQPITVSLWDGAAQIASTTANGPRPDVGSVIGDNGLHGYGLQLPAAYADGASHSLQIRFETSAVQLTGSPRTLTCGSSPANYAGYVDNLGCSTISGWVADRNRLNSSLSVDIYDGATLVTTTPAGGSRSDVGAALGDNGLHGFGLAIPASLKDSKTHTITVHPAGSSAVLAGPQSLTCPQ